MLATELQFTDKVHELAERDDVIALAVADVIEDEVGQHSVLASRIQLGDALTE